jgi:hypothetical protein
VPKEIQSLHRAGISTLPAKALLKGEKRPADVVGTAVIVSRIATGEIEEGTPPDDGKDPAAVALGRKGGKARAAGMMAKKRSKIAQKAARKRWEGA